MPKYFCTFWIAIASSIKLMPDGLFFCEEKVELPKLNSGFKPKLFKSGLEVVKASPQLSGRIVVILPRIAIN